LFVLALGAAGTNAALVQHGGTRVTLQAQVRPFKLPRVGAAPIAMSVAGHVAGVDGGTPQQLRRIDIKVNRNAHLDLHGYPTCRISQIQPAPSARALRDCGGAAIGAGHFWLDVVLPEQGTYPTQGRLLLFNGRYRGRPVLLAHVFSTDPFNLSFVLVFKIHHPSEGTYSTEVSTYLPRALGNWGYLDRIKLTLRGDRRAEGQRQAFFTASCPAPPDVRFVSYHLAFATLTFSDQTLSTRLDKVCAAKE
jgi:hypothetical protein